MTCRGINFTIRVSRKYSIQAQRAASTGKLSEPKLKIKVPCSDVRLRTFLAAASPSPQGKSPSQLSAAFLALCRSSMGATIMRPSPSYLPIKLQTQPRTRQSRSTRTSRLNSWKLGHVRDRSFDFAKALELCRCTKYWRRGRGMRRFYFVYVVVRNWSQA